MWPRLSEATFSTVRSTVFSCGACSPAPCIRVGSGRGPRAARTHPSPANLTPQSDPRAALLVPPCPHASVGYRQAHRGTRAAPLESSSHDAFLRSASLPSRPPQTLSGAHRRGASMTDRARAPPPARSDSASGGRAPSETGSNSPPSPFPQSETRALRTATPEPAAPTDDEAILPPAPESGDLIAGKDDHTRTRAIPTTTRRAKPETTPCRSTATKSRPHAQLRGTQRDGATTPACRTRSTSRDSRSFSCRASLSKEPTLKKSSRMLSRARSAPRSSRNPIGTSTHGSAATRTTNS